MSTFCIGGTISKSWALFKGNLGVVVVATIVATILGVLTGGILAGPMFSGLMLIFLKLMDSEGDACVEDVFKGFRWFFSSFLTVMVWGVVFGVLAVVLGCLWSVGVVALYLLSCAFGVFLVFALCDVVAHESSFLEASRTAYVMLKRDFWSLMGYGAIAELIGISGKLFFGVGLVVTIPFALLMLAVAYRECQNPPSVIDVESEIAVVV